MQDKSVICQHHTNFTEACYIMVMPSPLLKTYPTSSSDFLFPQLPNGVSRRSPPFNFSWRRVGERSTARRERCGRMHHGNATTNWLPTHFEWQIMTKLVPSYYKTFNTGKAAISCLSRYSGRRLEWHPRETLGILISQEPWQVSQEGFGSPQRDILATSCQNLKT